MVRISHHRPSQSALLVLLAAACCLTAPPATSALGLSFLGGGHSRGSSSSGCNWARRPESKACQHLAKQHLKHFSDWHNYPPKPRCEVITAGVGWAGHNICDFPGGSATKDCQFISFGIAHDWTFDTFLAVNRTCHGVGLDPTVSHPGTLVPEGSQVHFFPVGASMLDAADVLNKDWMLTSVPGLASFLHLDLIDVLKMDCEGCEYSIARDVAMEDPGFFHKVNQFAIEVHVPKVYMKTPRHAHYLGLLLAMLDAAGLRIQDYSRGPCGGEDEAAGCLQELLDAGFPCQRNTMCSSYLFARV